MKSNMFIPTKINVGYREREGTYTGKLAYVVYFDNKGVLRKETSWNSWRDRNIEPTAFENVPTSGFVLNKKAGGYSCGWNHRNTYCRVYDPRGFEFEINIENLLYILENTSSIIGKGLEGDFVYGWSGGDLVLMPVASPDYAEVAKINNAVRNSEFLKPADLIVGHEYLTSKNKRSVFMGKSTYYRYASADKKANETYFFMTKREENAHLYDEKYICETYRSVSGRILQDCSGTIVSDYNEIKRELDHNIEYSPIDPSKNVNRYYTVEEIIKAYVDDLMRCHWGCTFKYTGCETSYWSFDRSTNTITISERDSLWLRGKTTRYTIEEFVNARKPYYTKQYHQSGYRYKQSRNPLSYNYETRKFEDAELEE